METVYWHLYSAAHLTTGKKWGFIAHVKATASECTINHSTTALLLDKEVQCLSKRRVLVHVFILNSEILLFNADNLFQLSSYLRYTVWLKMLAYLADIFTEINKLYLPFQDTTNTTVLANKQNESFLYKTKLWYTHVEKYVTYLSITEWFSEWTWQSHKWLCTQWNIMEDNGITCIMEHLWDLQVTVTEYILLW